MTSKLDILAQKEEELRKINEQLDLKNDKIMSGALQQLRKDHGVEEEKKEEDPIEDSLAAGDENEFKGQLMKPPADDEEDDEYDDGFEESK